MASSVGWLLDAYVENNSAILWFKTDNGNVIRLHDDFFPDFFLEPQSGIDIECLRNKLLDHPCISGVDEKRRFTALGAREKSDVLRIFVNGIVSFRSVLRSLHDLRPREVKAFYNTDLTHIQRYLFSRNLLPTAKVEFQFNNGRKYLGASQINDEEELKPPFSMLTFDLGIDSQTLTPNPYVDPIGRIFITPNSSEPRSQARGTKTFEGEELEILKELEAYVKESDPDFLTSTHGEVVTLRYLLERAKTLGYNIQLGREYCDISKLMYVYPFALRGRVCVAVPVEASLTMPIGISGIMEIARYTVMPPNASSRKGGGGWSTDCRQSYEAYKKGVLLPSREDKGFFKFAVTARDVLVRDRGSLILSPKIGIHENVGACDFESMFPHIIKNYNLSYETVKPNYVQKNGQGFLCKISEQILKRRLELKRSRADYPKDSEDWWYAEQRQLALKMILVCFYGYSGCFANKFNNVTLYEEINAVARNCMLTTLRLARENSFETIYGDCDSIFEKKPDAKFADFEELCALVAQQTGLPMAVDRHYQFLVLLPQESDPDIEATRHYFGKLMNGDLYFRGIELRRHDYPKFLKDFQLKLMEVLFDADSSEKVMSRQYKEAMNFVLENYEKIVAGDIAPDELVISKILRKPVNEYRSMFPHVSAAMNMVQRGKKLRVGQAVNFVYVNSEHANPLRRVMPAELMNGDHYYYDREKYGEILLDIAETILGWNGFKRGRFGVKPKPKNFLEELRREKQQELILELRNLQDGRA